MRLWIAVGVFCILFVFSLIYASPGSEPEELTVSGKLTRVVGIGGETTGWAVRLDSATNVNGKSIESIEISGSTKLFLKLEGKHVKASGTIAVRHGVERGDWPVLQVTALEEIH